MVAKQALHTTTDNLRGTLSNLYKTLLVYGWQDNKANRVLRKFGNSHFYAFELVNGIPFSVIVNFDEYNDNSVVLRFADPNLEGDPYDTVVPPGVLLPDSTDIIESSERWDDFRSHLILESYIGPSISTQMFVTAAIIRRNLDNLSNRDRYEGTLQIDCVVANQAYYGDKEEYTDTVHVNGAYRLYNGRKIPVDPEDAFATLYDLGMGYLTELSPTKLVAQIRVPKDWWRFWIPKYVPKGAMSTGTIESLVKTVSLARSIYSKSTPVWGVEFVNYHDTTKRIRIQQVAGIYKVVAP
jgi:hypothetical protein